LIGDGDGPPKVLKASFYPRLQSGPALQRPKQECSQARLLELNRNLFFSQARVDFSALLPGGHNPGEHLAAFAEAAVDKTSNILACQKSGDYGAGEAWTAPRFLNDAKE